MKNQQENESWKKVVTAKYYFTLFFLAIIIGLASGFVAAGFKIFIYNLHHFLFYHAWSFAKISAAWLDFKVIPLVILGGLIAVFFIRNFAPEAEGHGLPELMEAIYQRGGSIRFSTGFIKACVSALSIGTGAPVGKEGPIAQVSGVIGSLAAWRLGSRERMILVAGGAAAGIAAIFNVPIGAIVLALELLLPEVSAPAFFSVMIMTGTATFVSYKIFGSQPAFSIPEISIPTVNEVPIGVWILLIILGLFSGLISAVFVAILDFCERVIPRLLTHAYLRCITCFFIVGFFLWFLAKFYGGYFIFDGGYDFIRLTLTQDISWHLCLVFIALQILGTSISLVGGASGGVFTPCLAIGAATGALFGLGATYFFPGFLGVREYTVLGMGAFLGSTTSAVLASVVMVLELTRNFNIVVPLIVVVPLAFSMRRFLFDNSIYTIKFARLGSNIPSERYAHTYLTYKAQDMASTSFSIFAASISLEELRSQITFQEDRPKFIIAQEEGKILGTATLMDILYEKQAEKSLRDCLRPLAFVSKHESARNILRRMNQQKGLYLCVLSEDSRAATLTRVHGIIGPMEIASAITKDYTT